MLPIQYLTELVTKSLTGLFFLQTGYSVGVKINQFKVHKVESLKVIKLKVNCLNLDL